MAQSVIAPLMPARRAVDLAVVKEVCLIQSETWNKAKRWARLRCTPVLDSAVRIPKAAQPESLSFVSSPTRGPALWPN